MPSRSPIAALALTLLALISPAGPASAQPARRPANIDDEALELPAPAGLAAAATARAGGTDPSVSQLPPAAALALLVAPAGSLSLGGTSGGRVERAAAIAPTSASRWAFMPHIPARQTTYGVDEMRGFLDRIGAAVRPCRRGAQLRVGNISLVAGGPSPWHKSHQAGRDVDVAPMLLDRSGKSLPADDYVVLDKNGNSGDGSRRKFDAKCTLRLAQAIAEDTIAPAQHIFLSRGLRALLLREAKRSRLDEGLVARISEMVRQPSDSAPHDDHLHIRLYCSDQDRRWGCLDRGPMRSWVVRDDAGYGRHIAQLASLAGHEALPVRRGATSLLGRLQTTLAVPALAARLLDADADVRRLALQGLTALGDQAAAEAMLAALGRVEDDALAVHLFGVARRLRAASMLAAARALLIDPAVALRPLVRARAGEALMLQAIAALRGSQPTPPPEAIEPLVAAAQCELPAVQRAADEALQLATAYCPQPEVGADAALRPVERQASPSEAAAAWAAFWQRNRTRPWTAWVGEGLHSRGVALLRPDAPARADVPTLVAALRHPSPVVVVNAARLLAFLTGAQPTARAGAAAAWQAWFRKHRREYPAAAAVAKPTAAASTRHKSARRVGRRAPGKR